MIERRTFIVRVHAHDDQPIVEDVSTGERVRLPDLASIADELKRRLDHATGDAAAMPAPQLDKRRDDCVIAPP